jgi:carboxyl-terminal processing protease
VSPSNANRSCTRWGSWPVMVLIALLFVHIIVTIASARNDDLDWFDPLIDVRSMVLDDFVEEADAEAMRNAAISAMLETLDDPYTIWIPPADESEFEKQLRGAYVGIGAQIAIEDDRLKIVTPLPDSPALAAGLRTGDIVLMIDSNDTLGFSTQDCIDLLLGEPGTTVDLNIRHLDGSEELITITRRSIRTKSVRGTQRIGSGWTHWLDEANGIAYIKITQFTSRTVNELHEALSDLRANGLQAIVLDLRFNGGGTLDGAIDTSDLFLDRGAIVSVRDRQKNGRTWTARDEEDDIDVPMIVLVNDSSASASEIVAGALQENDRAMVLGERTFGKGSVQEVRVLPDERGTLKLTTALYYLPSGRNIDRRGDAETWGVDPSPGFVIDLDNSDYADLFDAHLPYELIVDDAARPEGLWADPAWIETSLHDPQLAAALRSLKAKLADGEWLKVGGDPDPEASSRAELIDQMAYRTRLLEELKKATENIAELQANEGPLLDLDATLEGLGGRVLELTDGEGNVIARFRVDEPAALAAGLRAAGARAEPSEPVAP